MPTKTKPIDAPIRYRQGDVLLEKIDVLPAGAKLRKDKGDVVLKHGTATGHSHKFTSGAQVHKLGDNEYLEVTKRTADFVHDEHTTLKIPKGFYKIIQQREHTVEGIRNVMD